MNNAKRIIEQYRYGGYALPKDQLRLDNMDNIYCNGTLIGKFISLDMYDYCDNYLILSLQSFKSQKNWKTYQKQLAHAANEEGIPVIFISELDIGFDTKKSSCLQYYDYDSQVDNLLQVAKYSELPLKESCCAILRLNDRDEILAYTYNQNLVESPISCFKILTSYIEGLRLSEQWFEQTEINYYSTIRPEVPDILNMLDNYAIKILYGAILNDNWWHDSDDILLSTQLETKERLSYNNKPIRFNKVDNTKINKFYKVRSKL